MIQRSALTTTFASMQWLFFIFANTVVVPISVGTAFGLPAEEIAGIMRSSLIFTGIACMLQAWIGHRFPILEGHSGVMWGFILNIVLSASSLGMSLQEIGGGIATGMILAGAAIVFLGLFRLLGFMQKIFTPMVMSAYLFLLTLQLNLIFFKGMLAVRADGTLDLPVSLFSVAIVVLVVLLKIKGGQTVGNFSILIGILIGWIGYLLMFPANSSGGIVSSSFHLPLFPFGRPNLNMSIVIITFIASFINLSNGIAAVQAASDLLKQQATQGRMNRSYLLTGAYSIVAAILGLVSYAPFASSVGFLESTRIFERKPFIIAGMLMSILGIVPVLGGMLATIPITVGNAVLFVAYLQLLGTSFKSLGGRSFDSITIHRLALPVLAGVGFMNIDNTWFSGLPALLQPLLANGFIMGVIISITMEKLIRWDRLSA